MQCICERLTLLLLYIAMSSSAETRTQRECITKREAKGHPYVRGGVRVAEPGYVWVCVSLCVWCCCC